MLPPLLLVFVPAVQDAAPAVAVTEGFERSLAELPVGRVYHYRKSNVDGSRPSQVDLYVAAEDRIESFKWHEGGDEATLVVAEMDWTTFSVRRFRTAKQHRGGRVEEIAELAVRGDRIEGRAGELVLEARVERFPWHSYDFDLASLNVALRFLEDPEGTVVLGIVDFVRGADGPRLAAKGDVELAYSGREERGGVACRRYTLDGPGLEDRGGSLWVRAGEDPVIVEYEIDLPDEPGMESGKMVLLGSEELAPAAWEAWRGSKLR